MNKVREIIVRLKKLWAISKTYDRQVDVLSRGIRLAHERIGNRNSLTQFTDEQIHDEAIRRRYEYDRNGKPLWEIEEIRP